MFRPTARLPTLARTFSTSRPQAYRAKVDLIGYLAQAPEPVKASTGLEYVRYTVAVKGGSKENPKSNFFKVACFGEGSREYLLGLPKGTLVSVEGDLQTFTKEDEEGRKSTLLSITHRNLVTLRRPANIEQEE